MQNQIRENNPNSIIPESDKGNVQTFVDNEDNPESVFQESNNSHLEKNPDAIQEINCKELEILPDNLEEINAPCFISKAIAFSPILQEIEDKITLVEKQINYLEEKVAYYKSRNWTDYITMDAVKFVQNLFGGGEVQRTQLTITDLEIKSSALSMELINLEKEKVIKEEEIKLSVVEYLDKLQELQSKIQLLRKQQDNFEISRSAFLIKYQNGEGTTNQYLSYQDKGEKLEFQLLQLQNDFRQTLNKLSLLLGESDFSFISR